MWSLILAVLAVVPNHIIDELIKIQTHFIWKNTPAKIKHKTLISDHKQDGLKYADVTIKIISLQCSWLKTMTLFNDSFHEMKVIPLFYIKKTFGNNSKFDANLGYKLRNRVLLPKFYKQYTLVGWFTLLHLQSSLLVFWTNFYGTINTCELIK